MIKHALFFGCILGLAVSVPVVFQGNAVRYVQGWYHNAPASPAPTSMAFAVSPKPSKPAMAAPNGATVVIAMDERGHFETEFKINGRKLNALIDTGATYVAMNKSMASKIGIKIATKDMTAKVSTANGQAPAAVVMINEVAIGKIRVKNVQALVLDDKSLDGMLMGMSFLKELERFSIENKSLILQQ